MHAGFSLLALIPARSGSKGLPNKNVLNCAGKPLIEWTIAAAHGAVEIDEIIVSTDSENIAAVSANAGASVPFIRPASLAADNSSMLDVIKHAWENHLDSNGRYFDYVVLLQPTSPLRSSTHISEAIRLYFRSRRSDEDTLASVHPVNSKYGWLMERVGTGGYIEFCRDVRQENPQRQELPSFFLPNGAIFVIKGDNIAGGIYHSSTLSYVMDPRDSIDIDTQEDFRLAEETLRSRCDLEISRSS